MNYRYYLPRSIDKVASGIVAVLRFKHRRLNEDDEFYMSAIIWLFKDTSLIYDNYFHTTLNIGDNLLYIILDFI